ncbi:MAG: hypothetical protein EBY81_05400, partial [Verrucomicrobia bacterium]|nr:hypothetical protein [Verrucomicrobiota bacterium]
VANERMHLVMAQVLSEKGCDGFVFRGDDGLDEITLATSTSILSIGRQEIKSDRIDAKDFGLDNASLDAIVGGDSHENARISSAIFAGERGGATKRGNFGGGEECVASQDNRAGEF